MWFEIGKSQINLVENKGIFLINILLADYTGSTIKC